mmetsp:Transcript_105580/g.192009  ORF Transcript_105580/g.192009 Transcript_105580/m.192009 type:complete len:339 (-) Transcript_105580:166-1182(-)
MGCCESSPQPRVDLEIEPGQVDSIIGDKNLKVDQTICSPERLKSIQKALDLLDVTCTGKWSQLSWNQIQESAKATLVNPASIHQGNTTICGGVTLIELMATFRPEMYSKLVLSVWKLGRVIDCAERPWGEKPDLNPDLMAASPAKSVGDPSVADWMLATSILAECREQDFFREKLGHDEFLGQDTWNPKDGRTVDFAAGLTMPWEMARLMKELLGCTEVNRELCYWIARESISTRMVESAQKGEIQRGETVVVLLISATLWSKAKADPTLDRAQNMMAIPEHWVRLHSIKNIEGSNLEIAIFNMGKVEEHIMSKAAWGRVLFEAIFAKLNPSEAMIGA